jgi:mono/diheme cytochrome c family protein
MAWLGGISIVAMVTYALLLGCSGKKPSDKPPPSGPIDVEPPHQDDDTLTYTDLGSKVYAERCALCHGPQGKGDGPAAAAMNPKPRNHTDGSYMHTRTDAQLLEVIRHGKGSMPAWEGILSEQEIQAVLKHVRSLAK